MRDLSKGLPPDYTEEEFRVYSMAAYLREQEAKRCRLLDELILSWRELGNDPAQCERRIKAREAIEAAWPVGAIRSSARGKVFTDDEIREYAESFEECGADHDELVDMGDHDLIRVAYQAMADYAQGQM